MFDIKPHKSELMQFCDFTEIYENFRLVDPYTSEVYTLKDGKAVPSGDIPCYRIWNREKPCENCISLRTCRDRAQYIKLEYLNNSVLMIVSKPILLDGRMFSLELAADVTGSMVVQDEFHHEMLGISDLIEKANHLSVSDIFTGLYSNEFIKNKVCGLIRCGQTRPFSLLVIDIDHFKQVNDRHGHLAGDTVIQTIAALLNEFSARDGCFVGRMGGDEFCVIFENCTLTKAESIAEETAHRIRTHQYEEQGKSFTVDVSIGVGEYLPGEEAYDFIRRVDLAMYEVKHTKASGK